MGTDYSITEKFGGELARLLAGKIQAVYRPFKAAAFITDVTASVASQTYTQRVVTIAGKLNQYLPADYKEAVAILMDILGAPNPNETGMFTHFYWVLPIGKFVELFGTAHFSFSMKAIEEITKRNTGEYAVRPYIRQYPRQSLARIRKWALSKDFHLRRLASEGLRPKLPWATRLDTFNDHPQPVFEILELLKEDPVAFVKRSVANHLADWLKTNYDPTVALIHNWRKSDHIHTQWIIRHATRKIKA